MFFYSEVSEYPYLTTAVSVVVILFLVHLCKTRNLPGPWGLPYFGHYPFLSKDFHLKFTELARQRYGDVFFFEYTGQLYVHLASFDVINEAHIKRSDCFPDRGDKYSLLTAVFDKGIVVDKGESWKVQRKFFVQIFREIASKEALSGPVADAIQTTLKKLHEAGPNPVRFMGVLTEPCVKAASYMNFGSGNDDLIPSISNAYERMARHFGLHLFLITGEFARYFILPWYRGFRETLKVKQEMEALLYKIIARRENAIRAGEADDCLVDRYLEEREKRKRRGDPQAEFFNDSALIPTLIELFGDGSVTIAALVTSFLAELSHRAEVQEKMRKEMLEVLGDDLTVAPTLDDKARLPYVNAVLKELYRCSSIIPIGASLRCARETTIGGLRVPEGSVTMINSWAANHDPRIYFNPDEFRPERFLSYTSEGVKINQQQQQPYFFGVGKRACAGEFLTSMMVFCFTTAVIRNFVLKPTKNLQKDLSFVDGLDTEVVAVPIKMH